MNGTIFINKPSSFLIASEIMVLIFQLKACFREMKTDLIDQS